MMTTCNKSKYISADTRRINIVRCLRIQGMTGKQIERRIVELIHEFKGLQGSADIKTDAAEKASAARSAVLIRKYR